MNSLGFVDPIYNHLQPNIFPLEIEMGELGFAPALGLENTPPLEGRAAHRPSLVSTSPANANTDLDLIIDQTHDWNSVFSFSSRNKQPLFDFFYKEEEHKTTIEKWIKRVKTTLTSFDYEIRQAMSKKGFERAFSEKYCTLMVEYQNKISESKHKSYYLNKSFINQEDFLPIIKIKISAHLSEYLGIPDITKIITPPKNAFVIPVEYNEIFYELLFYSWIFTSNFVHTPRIKEEAKRRVAWLYETICNTGLKQQRHLQDPISPKQGVPFKSYDGQFDLGIAGATSAHAMVEVHDAVPQPTHAKRNTASSLHVATVPLAYLDAAKAPALPMPSSAAREDKIESYVRLTFKFLKDTQPVDYKTTPLREGSMSALLLSPLVELETQLPLTAIVAGRGGDALIPGDDDVPILIVTTEDVKTAGQWVGKNRQVLILESFFNYPPEHLSLPSTRRAMAMWAATCLGQTQVFILDDNVEKWCIKEDRSLRWADLVKTFQDMSREHGTAILGATEHTQKEWNRNKRRLTSEQMKADVKRTGAKAHFIEIPKLLNCVQGNWLELIPPLPDLPQGDQLLYFIARAGGCPTGKVSSESLLFIRTEKTCRLAPRVLKKANHWIELDTTAYSPCYQQACATVKKQVEKSLKYIENENEIVREADLKDYPPHFNQPTDMLELQQQSVSSARQLKASPVSRPQLPNFDHTQIQVELTAAECLEVLRKSLSSLQQDEHLRNDQKAICKSIEERCEERLFQLTMATGLGKSEMMCRLSVEAFKNFNGKWNVVVITRNLDQTTQAYERICRIANNTIPVLYIGSHGLQWKQVAINRKANTQGQIIVGCQQSIKLLNDDHPDFLKRVGLFLMDETHKIHETLFDKIIEIARDRAIIAFSATPGERVEKFCEIKGMDALEGMRAGFLAPWHTHRLSWDDFYSNGELSESRLMEFLADHQALMQHHLLIVVPSIPDAERMEQAINQIYANKAISITAKSLPGIEKILQTTEFGPKIGIVVNKLLVGFDSAYLRNALILKPMEKDLATQALGRILRKDPADKDKLAGFWMTEKVKLRSDYVSPSPTPSRWEVNAGKRQRDDADAIPEQKQARPSAEYPSLHAPENDTRKHKREEVESDLSHKRPRPAEMAAITYILKKDCFSIPVKKGTSLEDAVQQASRLVAAYQNPLHKAKVLAFSEKASSLNAMRDLQLNGWKEIQDIIDTYQLSSAPCSIYNYDHLNQRYQQTGRQNGSGEDIVHIRKLPDNQYHVLLKKR